MSAESSRGQGAEASQNTVNTEKTAENTVTAQNTQTAQNTENTVTARRRRLPELDILRAFALFGILVVNIQYFIQPEIFSDALSGEYTAPDHTWYHLLVVALFENKFFLIFTFLFGVGISMQKRSSRKLLEGTEDPARYQKKVMHRRFIVLAVLGILHGVLLFLGDILFAYAVLGALLLYLSEGRTHRFLVVAAIGVYAAVSLLLLGSAVFSEGGEVSYGHSGALSWSEMVMFYPVMLLTVVMSQGLLGFTAMLLGYVLSEKDMLSSAIHWIQGGGVLRSRYVIICAVLGLVLNGAAGWLVSTGTTETAHHYGAALSYMGAPLLAAVYMAVVVRVYPALSSASSSALSSVMSSMGRMSLSVYLMQSVVMAAVFTWFGLSDAVSSVYGLPVAVVVWLLLAGCSHLWMRRFSNGPVEAGMRRYMMRGMMDAGRG